MSAAAGTPIIHSIDATQVIVPMRRPLGTSAAAVTEAVRAH